MPVCVHTRACVCACAGVSVCAQAGTERQGWVGEGPCLRRGCTGVGGGGQDANCSLWQGFWSVTGWLRPRPVPHTPSKILLCSFLPQLRPLPQGFPHKQPSGVETGQNGGGDS